MVSENGAKVFCTRIEIQEEENSTERRAQHSFDGAQDKAAPLQGNKKNRRSCKSGGAELRLAKLLRFFFDVGFYFGGYIAKDFYGYGIFADGFDGFLELDLALIDLEALRG